MFILRKLLKLLLLPVFFVLFFINWALTVSLKLSEGIVGLFTLFVGGGVIYSLFCKQWSNAFIFAICFAGVMIILALCTVIQDTIENLMDAIGEL